MTPTDEQQAIIDLARDPQSLLINALAGAAKTTTLCLLAAKLPLEPTVCVAFNKRIAVEMAQRMPSHIQCSTLNSLGHRVWGAKLGRRLRVETDKSYSILQELVGKLRPEQRNRAGEAFASVLRMTRLAKSAGYVPKKMRSMGKSLVTADDLIEAAAPQLDVNPDDEFLALVEQSLELSIAQAFQGTIDFDDQIYMSTLFSGGYPKFPIVLVDEAQDLSPLNHETLRLLRGDRLVAVGDPYQSIYAFRGAHHGSMGVLKDEFSMREMTLSVSFRCPQAVVTRARWRVPHFKFADWAEPGIVSDLEEWSAATIPDGAAIICRNNAPLFRVAMRLIRAGRGVHLVGADIGKALVTTLKKLGPGGLTREQTVAAILEWEETQTKKAHRARLASIRDRAECLRVFAEFGATLDEAVAYAKHLFEATGPIQLLTGHKAKGMEYDTVFHLDPQLIPSKFAIRLAEAGDCGALEQEKNLRYVIETRAKQELYLIRTEDMT